MPELSDRPTFLRHALAALICMTTMRAAIALAQGDFQIVWVAVGEAATSTSEGATRAGRQLFMASDLISLSLRNVKVARVETTPTHVQVAVGERLCVSSLRVLAFDHSRERIAGAPLAIAVRLDHRDELQLQRSTDDICMQPVSSGEFPLRFTSLLPAQDGTIRGAQMFLHVLRRASASSGRPD